MSLSIKGQCLTLNRVITTCKQAFLLLNLIFLSVSRRLVKTHSHLLVGPFLSGMSAGVTCNPTQCLCFAPNPANTSLQERQGWRAVCGEAQWLSMMRERPPTVDQHQWEQKLSRTKHTGSHSVYNHAWNRDPFLDPCLLYSHLSSPHPRMLIVRFINNSLSPYVMFSLRQHNLRGQSFRNRSHTRET